MVCLDLLKVTDLETTATFTVMEPDEGTAVYPARLLRGMDNLRSAQ